MFQSDTLKGATFSECKRFRFTLTRRWSGDSVLAVIGLNPSTADETQDDPTIRRICNFAWSSGYGGLTMLNLWAFRSTDPKALTGIECENERHNMLVIADAVASHGRTIAAWGANKHAGPRAAAMLAAIKPTLYCWGTTKDGSPRHPLYLPNTATMRLWSVEGTTIQVSP